MKLARAIVTLTTLGLAGLLAVVALEPLGADEPPAPVVVAPPPPPVDTGPVVRTLSHRVQKGEALGGILQEQGITGVAAIVQEASPHVDLARIRPGQELEFTFVDDRPTAFRYVVSEDETLEVELGEVPVARLLVQEYDRSTERIALEIDSSLWQAGVSQGLSPASVMLRLGKHILCGCAILM